MTLTLTLTLTLTRLLTLCDKVVDVWYKCLASVLAAKGECQPL